jgi:hypothetical protein
MLFPKTNKQIDEVNCDWPLFVDFFRIFQRHTPPATVLFQLLPVFIRETSLAATQQQATVLTPPRCGRSLQ